MRILPWMCGVTKLDKIRNVRIRGTTKVGKITKKVQESSLKWYGHVMRREEHYVGRRAIPASNVPLGQRCIMVTTVAVLMLRLAQRCIMVGIFTV